MQSRNLEWNLLFKTLISVQKVKFFIKDFFSKCDQIRRKLRIWSHLLRKSLMENFICLCSRSKGLKLQKVQGYLLKSIGTISNVTNNLLGQKINKKWTADEIRKIVDTLIHGYIDSIAILNSVNKNIEHIRREYLVIASIISIINLREMFPISLE